MEDVLISDRFRATRTAHPSANKGFVHACAQHRALLSEARPQYPYAPHFDASVCGRPKSVECSLNTHSAWRPPAGMFIQTFCRVDPKLFFDVLAQKAAAFKKQLEDSRAAKKGTKDDGSSSSESQRSDAHSPPGKAAAKAAAASPTSAWKVCEGLSARSLAPAPGARSLVVT